MSDEMFTVDLEFRNGTRTHPQFVTQQEALAYAGRMAMDSRVHRAEVRGLGMDAIDGGPGSGPHPDGGGSAISHARATGKIKMEPGAQLAAHRGRLKAAEKLYNESGRKGARGHLDYSHLSPSERKEWYDKVPN